MPTTCKIRVKRRKHRAVKWLFTPIMPLVYPDPHQANMYGMTTVLNRLQHSNAQPKVILTISDRV